MCHVCVMESVKARMLSRRDLFRGGAAAAAATAVGTGAAQAGGHGGVVDMTHTYGEEFPTYFGTPGVSREATMNFAEHGVNLFQLTLMEHTGTHIDAPLHFSADGASVDEIPVGQLVVPLCKIDIAARAADNPDTEVTPDDLKAWTAEHGDIPQGACVALHSGWADKVESDGFRNADGDGVMHFPGFHVEATQMLLEETQASAIAVDTLSLDHGPSSTFGTHYAWLPAGRYGIECLAGLDQVPAAGATLVVGAPKLKGGTGGPARIFAML